MRRQNKILLGVAKIDRKDTTRYRARAYVYGKYISGPYRDTPEEAHKDYLEIRKKYPYRNRGPKVHPAGLPKLSQKDSDAINDTSIKDRLKSKPTQSLKGTPFYGL